jgi:hypothetical protein
MSPQVSYESQSSVYVHVARLIRAYYVWKERPVGGKNIAIILVDKAVFGREQHLAITATSDPAARVHSEPAVIYRLYEVVKERIFKGRCTDSDIKAWVNDQCRDPNSMSLYTEREPCGIGGGMANCKGFLAKEFPDMAVEYSFNYPSSGKEELDTIIHIHQSLGIYDEKGCETLREYFSQLGKEDREDVTKTLKAVDQELKSLDKAGRKRVVGKEIELAISRYEVIPY